MITFGNTSIEINLIAVFVAILTLQLLPIVFVIWFAVRGFRVHWGWGLANIFLFPLAGIALFLTHRQEARFPMIIWSLGMALLVILMICASL